MGYYDTAQICLNGHVINQQAQTQPERNIKFCDQCGSPTIAQCPACGAPLRGYHHTPGSRIHGIPMGGAPAFCYECGRPYPWTESALQAAYELADEIGALDAPERELLKKSIDDIIRDTPRTPAAALHFKKYASKGGAAIVEGLKSILFGLATDAAKKMIWS